MGEEGTQDVTGKYRQHSRPDCATFHVPVGISGPHFLHLQTSASL